MNYLALVADLHAEAKLPGDPPSAVTSQTGRAADLVRWVKDSYTALQQSRDGKWRWLRRQFYVNTVADDNVYASTDCTDTIAASAISRFRAWDMSVREPWWIYLVSAGKENEGELRVAEWDAFSRRYIRGSHDSGIPGEVAIDMNDWFYLGPTPDDIYRITGHYWRSSQILAADSDTPEMPSEFHKVITYEALTRYGYDLVAPEILARAQREGAAMYDALRENQGYSRAKWGLPDGLA